MLFYLILLFPIKLFAQEYISKEITVYDYQLDQPGQSIYIGDQSNDNSEISLDVFKELNLSANLLMTKTNISGGVQNLYLRGTSADQIQISYDGAVLNDPSHPSRGYNFSEFSSFSLSSIDIYYGPHSTLVGNYANAGAINLKSLEVESPTFIFKAGSYDSFGNTILIPVKKYNQQWEWQNFKSRGMSAYSGGEEHDGLTDNLLKVKGTLNLPSNYNAKYFILARFRSEDLDFGGGAEPEDLNYRSKDRMILPYIEFNGEHFGCVDNTFSLQKTFRKRETNNQADAVNSNELFFLSHSQLEIAKISIDQKCFERFTSKIVLEHNKESMRLLEVGTTTSEIKDQQQTMDSFSLNQDIIINTQSRFTVGTKLDLWEKKADLGSYRFGFSHIAFKNLLIAPSVSYARKIPSLYQLYSTFGNEDLKREKNWQYEILFSQNLRKVNWELVPYFSQYQEMVDFDFLTSKYINTGDNKIYGFENRNTLKINSQFGSKINVNYLRAYNTKTSNDLLLRPKWQGSNSWYYKIDQSSYELQAQYIGSRSAVDPVTFITSEAPSIFLLHALYQYVVSSKLKFDLSLQNILNKKYNYIPGYSALGLAAFGEVTYSF